MSLLKRTLQLNSSTSQTGKCVLYVMSRDQRVHDNHALYFAQQEALRHKVPLAVVFCLRTHSGYRSREQYAWMIDGLKEIERTLAKVSIPLLLLIGNPKDTLEGLIHHTTPRALYFDMSPLRGAQKLHASIATSIDVPVYEVDTHNIVPVWVASNKQEYAARTIRNKINILLPQYIDTPKRIENHSYSWPGVVKPIQELHSMITKSLDSVLSNSQLISFKSGEHYAQKQLQSFISTRLRGYAHNRNDPTLEGQSDLSPYIHFGQISTLRIFIEISRVVQSDPSLKHDADTFIEELVIRKELSDNFCFYNQNYDSLQGASQWAQDTLQKHENDQREFEYSLEDIVTGNTQDLAWNASQKQLIQTGKMHGYMRMYWAKKLLEWSPRKNMPQATHSNQHELLQKIEEDTQGLTGASWAIKVANILNDFYSIDGGDPNGYTGILWSIAGLHDRPWFERPVYGTIRYMNYNGLKRKFNIEEYNNRY